MSWELIAVVFVVLAGITLLRWLFQSKESIPAYRQRSGFLTHSERSFYGVLQQAVGANSVVFGKVRVADVLTPQKGLSRPKWQSAFNRISAKHFDFLLCDPSSLSVQCAIELNDSSHRAKKRAARDRFLREACESAGLRLVEINAKKGYSVQEIRDAILGHGDA